MPESLFNKVTDLRLAILLRKDSGTDTCFLVYFAKF